MWKSTAIVVCSVAALALAGCGPSQPEHTVSWYQAHTKAKKAVLAKCREDPGTLAKTPDCKNAERADVLDSAQSGGVKLTPIK